jgi:hypothetical protein
MLEVCSLRLTNQPAILRNAWLHRSERSLTDIYDRRRISLTRLPRRLYNIHNL